MKILCAVDGSECARWGVEALQAFAARPPDSVILLHVVDTSGLKTLPRATRSKLARSLDAMKREGARLLHTMDQIARSAIAQAVTAPRTKIACAQATGPVPETIVRQAVRRRADLVVVGSRGLSDIRGFLLGSVSRRIVALGPKPVLVVKRPLREIARVVLAVDASKHSQAAVGFLLSSCLPDSASVTILSVIQPPVTELGIRVLSPKDLDTLMTPIRARAHDLVAKVREQLIKEGCAVTTEVREGHPAQTIVSYAEQVRADLVVLGSRGLFGTERALLGSVSEGVLKYAPCSVLIVHRALR